MSIFITWLACKPAKYFYCICNISSSAISHISQTFDYTSIFLLIYYIISLSIGNKWTLESKGVATCLQSWKLYFFQNFLNIMWLVKENPLTCSCYFYSRIKFDSPRSFISKWLRRTFLASSITFMLEPKINKSST